MCIRDRYNTVWPGPRPTSMPSFIFIHPTVWPQCTNVTDRQTDRQTGQTGQDRQRTDSIGRTVLQTVAQKGTEPPPLQKNSAHFYGAPQCSHCKRCTSYSNSVRPSVCLSVRLSHAGIVSKRRHLARCCLHCWIAKCV